MSSCVILRIFLIGHTVIIYQTAHSKETNINYKMSSAVKCDADLYQ